jgi:hypothetical protein
MNGAVRAETCLTCSDKEGLFIWARGAVLVGCFGLRGCMGSLNEPGSHAVVCVSGRECKATREVGRALLVEAWWHPVAAQQPWMPGLQPADRPPHLGTPQHHALLHPSPASTLLLHHKRRCCASLGTPCLLMAPAVAAATPADPPPQPAARAGLGGGAPCAAGRRPALLL